MKLSSSTLALKHELFLGVAPEGQFGMLDDGCFRYVTPNGVPFGIDNSQIADVDAQQQLEYVFVYRC
ncbi:MAG TPA: hypothetical protein VMI35_09850 [Puia sp.]|nr:hypothetical protein [Puia sp.]